jgi:outer membrane protein OmpA-like peptidoglycan-associated protein
VPEDIERLDKVANILKKYKDKGLMIIGHTTDKGTEEGRKKLSLERAKVIIEFLKQKDAINLPKSSFGGKGGTEPIADNSTEEGMKKNRRVEIYILEE